MSNSENGNVCSNCLLPLTSVGVPQIAGEVQPTRAGEDRVGLPDAEFVNLDGIRISDDEIQTAFESDSLQKQKRIRLLSTAEDKLILKLLPRDGEFSLFPLFYIAFLAAIVALGFVGDGIDRSRVIKHPVATLFVVAVMVMIGLMCIGAAVWRRFEVLFLYVDSTQVVAQSRVFGFKRSRRATVSSGTRAELVVEYPWQGPHIGYPVASVKGYSVVSVVISATPEIRIRSPVSIAEREWLVRRINRLLLQTPPASGTTPVAPTLVKDSDCCSRCGAKLVSPT